MYRLTLTLDRIIPANWPGHSSPTGAQNYCKGSSLGRNMELGVDVQLTDPISTERGWRLRRGSSMRLSAGVIRASKDQARQGRILRNEAGRRIRTAEGKELVLSDVKVGARRPSNSTK